VTLATFPVPTAASFMKSLLIAEGTRAYLADEIAVGMLWHLSIAIGWVKLQVAEADVARATRILEEYRQAVDDLGQEAFAAEAISSPAADKEPDNMLAATVA